MQRLLPWGIVWSLASSLGCADVELAELRDVELSWMTPSSNGDAGDGTLLLTWGRPAGDWACPTMARSVEATFDGVDARRVERGQGGFTNPDTGCDPFTLTARFEFRGLDVEAARGEAIDIVVRDGDDSISMTIIDPLTARTVSSRREPYAGDRATFTWSHDTDRLGTSATATYKQGADDDSWAATSSVEVEGSKLTTIIPSELAAGTYVVEIEPGAIDAETCDLALLDGEGVCRLGMWEPPRFELRIW